MDEIREEALHLLINHFYDFDDFDFEAILNSDDLDEILEGISPSSIETADDGIIEVTYSIEEIRRKRLYGNS
jgi:hypothetical protein